MIDRNRAWLAALLLGLASEALFLLHLARPHKLVFDEVHYVPAARALLALEGPVNTEHPLFAKEFIALGIRLFDDTSFGWRFFSTIAGTATVLAIFAIALLLTGRLRPAVIAGLLTLTSFLVFVQARIAMLDTYMAAFALTGLAALLWARRAPPRRAWPRWLLGSALLGLAVASKWAAAPLILFVAIGFVAARALGSRERHWPGLATLPALLALGLVSIAAYFTTFAPAFFYARDPLTPAGLIAFQLQMYREQVMLLPHHTYQSRWWSWPLLLRPIWYFYEPADGAMRGVLMLGNPVTMWGGLVAVAACLWRALRDRSAPLAAIAGLWLGSFGMWALIPKAIGFYYYYYLPGIILSLAIALAFDHWRTRTRGWDEAFVVLSFGAMVYFWKILSAAALSGPAAFHHWMWFTSWI